MKSFSKVLCSVAAALGFATVSWAGPVTYALQGFTFNDGGSATGSFTYDAGSNAYSYISIATSGGGVAPAVFTVLGPNALPFQANFLAGSPAVGVQGISMQFSNPGGGIALSIE